VHAAGQWSGILVQVPKIEAIPHIQRALPVAKMTEAKPSAEKALFQYGNSDE
jgi:hypothetical protein